MGGEGDAGQRLVHGVPVSAVGGAGPGEGGAEEWDATVLVTAPDLAPPDELRAAVEQALQFDAALDKECGVVPCAAAWGGRLVLAPTGPLTPYHDVRSVAEAAAAGVARAAAAGARRPVLLLRAHPRWPRAPLVALLAALRQLHVPLQLREAGGEPARARLLALGACAEAALRAALPQLLREAAALETARGLARDVGDADPERGAPLACAELVRSALAPLGVAVRVISNAAELARRYPLLAAVNRAAAAVPRHAGCVLLAEYCPAEYKQTVMLVGKGVTYDTGGCDVKAGGAMAGMSRDKCGAAAAAGFVQACALLRADTRVLCALGFVRNSIGEEAYVADEVLVARGGQRVRVGNTDAEGRLVMADLLAEMRERAEAEFGPAETPHLYTLATLTGHAGRAVGEGYSIALDNHAAAAAAHAAKLQAGGDSVADPFEVSTLRREDLAAHAGRARGDGLHQADSRPSSALPRGHQTPAAFLMLAAGLAAGAVPYTHVDVAASAGAFPAPPTAAPLLALAARYGLVRSC